jgi:SAM-dependent methyltransferase
MTLEELERNWESFGKTDPLWAILTTEEKKGNQWSLDAFLQTGTTEINEVLRYQRELGLEPAMRKALDFGCGVGRLTQALAEHFDEVIGVDIAASMVAKAEQLNRHAQKATYVVNRRNDLALFDDDCFDFIYSNIVLQHMRPAFALRYIREFIRVLRPGGCLVFQIPSDLKPRPAEGRSIQLKRRLREFTPAPILKLSRRLRGLDKGGPAMEMHGIPVSRLVRILDREATIVDIRAEQAAGPEWRSFRYCVTKAH